METIMKNPPNLDFSRNGVPDRADRPTGAAGLSHYLATRDLVFRGTVVQVVDAERRYAGGCATPIGGASKLKELHVAVDSVLDGICSDSVVRIATPFNIDFESLSPGTRVLGWGYRDPADAWQLEGNVVVITAAETILPLSRSPLMRNDPTLRTGTVPVRDVTDWPDSLKASVAPVLYARADRIALARVLTESSHPGGRMHYGLEFLEWIVGSGSTRPTELDLTLPMECWPEFVRGDSILVPMWGDTAAVAIRGCGSALEVRCGYLPGMGIRLSQIGEVLELTGTGVTIRRKASWGAR